MAGCAGEAEGEMDRYAVTLTVASTGAGSLGVRGMMTLGGGGKTVAAAVVATFRHSSSCWSGALCCRCRAMSQLPLSSTPSALLLGLSGEFGDGRVGDD